MNSTVSMPHAALWVVQQVLENVSPADIDCFNAARGFVGGAAAMSGTHYFRLSFQCRTRLCGWCSQEPESVSIRSIKVSMPHAALWVVQPLSITAFVLSVRCFNAARGFVGGAASSLSALVPLRGKRPFGKSPEI